MKLYFLGSGNGRYYFSTQIRKTAGLAVEVDGKVIIVDPGGSTLLSLRNMKIDRNKIKGILVTHNHPDHVNDISMVVEFMTENGRKKKGFVIAPESVYTGTVDGSTCDYLPFSFYHQKLVKNTYRVEEGDTVNEDNFKIEVIKAVHYEPKAVGYIINDTLTIFGDSYYYKGMEDNVRDVVIFNYSAYSGGKYHTTAEVIAKVLSKTEPKKVIISWISKTGDMQINKTKELLYSVFEKEKILFVKDGLVVDLSQRTLI